MPNPPSPQTDDTPTLPNPWRWLRRTAIGLGIWTILIVALWLGWDHEATRRLNAKIAQYQAAGEPILPEDFAIPAIPDDENAATYYAAAYAAIRVGQIDHEIDQDDWISVWESDPEEMLRPGFTEKNWLEENTDALLLFRRAAKRTSVNWDIDLHLSYDDLRLRHLHYARILAEFSTAAAIATQHARKPDQALELIEATIRQSAHLQQSGALDINNIFVTRIQFMVCYALEKILTRSPRDRFDPTIVQRLIASLLAAASNYTGDYRDFATERMVLMRTISNTNELRIWVGLNDQTIIPSPLGVVFQPMSKLDAIFAASLIDSAIQDVMFETYTLSPAIPASDSHLQWFSHIQTWYHVPPYDRAILLEFRVRAMSRMAALALAIELYRADHNEIPAKLNALVPDYISELPRDPFRSDGKSFGLIRDDAFPRLTSLNDDGIDQGGSYNTSWYLRYNSPDLVFFLSSIPEKNRRYLSAFDRERMECYYEQHHPAENDKPRESAKSDAPEQDADDKAN